MKKAMKSGLFVLFALVAAVVPTRALWAHGGASVDIDTCIVLIGSSRVHFTAYTPQLTADAEYCNTIPKLGRTNLVFDYEDRKLRNMTIEFEITKEPEGTRIYYQEPATHKTGTVNAVIDFNQYGEGDYLAHVTLVNEDQKVDAHLGFTVGKGIIDTSRTFLILAVVAVVGLLGLYFLNPAFKQKVDAKLGTGQASGDEGAQ